MTESEINLQKSKELRACFPFEVDLLWLERTASTSTLVKKWIKQRPLSPLIVRVADVQTEGRGSRGRVWENCEDSLLLSVGIRWNRPIREMTGLTLLLGVKVIDILKELGVFVKMKWPNDLYIDGKKFAGLLCEVMKINAEESFLVIGIGINCWSTNPQYGDIRALTEKLKRTELIRRIVLGFQETVSGFSTEKLKSLRDSWSDVDLWRDREVFVLDESGVCRTGFMKGITEEGYCRVLINDEEKIFRNATIREKRL